MQVFPLNVVKHTDLIFSKRDVILVKSRLEIFTKKLHLRRVDACWLSRLVVFLFFTLMT